MAHLLKALYQLGGRLPFAQLGGQAGAVAGAGAGLVFANFVTGHSLHFLSPGVCCLLLRCGYYCAAVRIGQLPFVGSSFAFKAGAFVKMGPHMTRPCLNRLLVRMLNQVFSAAHGPIKVHCADGRLVIVSIHFLQSSGM